MKTCPERKRKVLKAKTNLLEADLVCNLASFASFARSAERQLGNGVEMAWNVVAGSVMVSVFITPRCFLVVPSQLKDHDRLAFSIFGESLSSPNRPIA